MADSQRIFDPGARFVDENGDPIAGGTLYFYQAGTSTPRTVYTDADLIVALGTTCELDSGGYPTTDGNTKTLVYTGTSNYKVIIKDGDGNTIATHDEIAGALDTSTFGTTYAIGTSPVIAETSAYTVTTDDEGKHIACDPTGGSFALTLPSAVTAGDGFRLPFSHNADSDNVAYFIPSGTQTIGGKSGYVIRRRSGGQLVSDGANWRVEATRTPFFKQVIEITDRLTAAPSAPSPGAMYIVNGTATGTWSTLGFSQHDIAEANGNGGWIKWTPADGWMAYVRDENLVSVFIDTAWTDWSNVTAPTTSTHYYAIWEDQKANGTDGGAATTAAWTTRALNAEVTNTITGASLASNQITIPVGKYFVSMQQAFRQTANTLSRLKVISGTVDITELRSVPHVFAVTDGAGNNEGHSHSINHSGFINVTATAVVELQYYAGSNGAAGQSLGTASTEPENDVETFARVSLLNLTSIQGPSGSQGIPGASSGVFYQFDTSTTMAAPSAGFLRLNNATLASVTGAAINVGTADTGNPSIAGFIAQWDQSTTTSLRGVLVIKKFGSQQNYAIYSITGASTNNTTWYQLSLTHIASAGSWSASDQLCIEFYRTGNAGGGDVTANANFGTDNVLIRADGTGKGTQSSGLALSDSNIFTDSNGLKSSHATAGIGYATGAGSTVTQATNKGTGVTSNTCCCDITMNNAALAAATIVSFVWTSSAIAATDIIDINHISGGTLGAYTFNAAAASGSATIYVRNATGGSLGEAIVIRCQVRKGANS